MNSHILKPIYYKDEKSLGFLTSREFHYAPESILNLGSVKTDNWLEIPSKGLGQAFYLEELLVRLEKDLPTKEQFDNW
jgi:hypothetical protein